MTIADGAGNVDVIIVAHNAGELLGPCVASAQDQAGADSVLVIDTESTDGSVERVARTHPGVVTVRVENRGFSFANNVGIERTRGEFVLLLNPDAELENGALDALVRCAREHPRAGIIGAKVLNPDGSRQANQAGTFPSLAQVLGLRVWRAWQRLRGNDRLSPRDFSKTRDRDWVTGACMLVRRSAMDTAGTMDEGYFLYYEDVEWCHRMRDHGWRVLQEPSARVIHHLGKAGSGTEFARRAYRDSFFRYCAQYRLWGLRAAARIGLSARAHSRGARP